MGQAPSDDLLFPHALADPVRRRLRDGGQVAERGDDALVLLKLRLVLADCAREMVETVAQDLDRRSWLDRERGLVVPQPERSRLDLEGQFLILEDAAVLVAKH